MIKCYGKLCSVIRDVNEIAPHCVSKKIITPQDVTELYSVKNPSKQVAMLLSRITGPVKAGSSQVFYDLLDIMEMHGLQATQLLATEVKCSLNTESSCTHDCVS